MKRRSAPAAAAMLLVLGATPAPCAAIPAPATAALQAFARFPTPTVTRLDGTRLIGEADTGTPLGGVTVFVAAGLDREPERRSGVAALVAESIVRTQVDGVPLRDAVAARGGSVDYTIDARSARFSIEGRPADLPALVTLLGEALAKPDFSMTAAARSALDAAIADDQSNALTVGIQMFRRAYYAGTSGLPALGTPDSLAQLGPPDARAFYAATYRRQALTASAVGDASPGLATALRNLVAALPGGTLAPALERANALAPQPERIIAQRDVAGPWVVLGYRAPSPSSPDFGPMLVLQALLAGAFQRPSTTALRSLEKPIGALYLYDAAPAGMIVYVNGGVGNPSLALRQVLAASRALAAKPLGAGALARFKAAAAGHLLADSVDLSDRAYLLGNFSAQGLGDDPINAALVALERTTPADLQHVAKRYLQRYIVALVLPRTRVSTGS